MRNKIFIVLFVSSVSTGLLFLSTITFYNHLLVANERLKQLDEFMEFVTYRNMTALKEVYELRAGNGETVWIRKSIIPVDYNATDPWPKSITGKWIEFESDEK